MRRDYWQGLCNIWATERWQETSITMKANQAANLEANKHTSRFVSFATHQSRLESYSQHMTEKYVGEEKQPQLDAEVPDTVQAQLYQAISQALSQVSILPQAAPSTSV
ncbi:hypothetical protein Taro_002546 [Colocasia esculenta]|uniref:Uncharacterized protein n=1 Tax=Colocasia esculenta TaxID=4460 RepID=A0A843TCV8_COLES|nr:hypothetical protein [Colocasia esculenta]